MQRLYSIAEKRFDFGLLAYTPTSRWDLQGVHA
jgi:hypothetical protein